MVVVMGSGRCHGPNCRQEALVDFCSERCSQAWHTARWRTSALPDDLPAVLAAVSASARIAAPLLARNALTVQQASGGMADLADALRAACPPEPSRQMLDGAAAALAAATYPQVASENPQVTHTGQDGMRGWLQRWLDRLTFAEWLAWRLVQVESHEAREYFRDRMTGRPVFDPHDPVEPGGEAAA